MKDLILKLKDYSSKGSNLSGLEKQLGIPTGTLSKGVTGERAIPMKYLQSLEDYFKVYYSNTVTDVKGLVFDSEHLVSRATIYSDVIEEVIPGIGATEKIEKALGFNDMLVEFERLIKGIGSYSEITEKVKISLRGLRTLADVSGLLNYRQRDAIMGRCDNFLGKNWRPFAKLGC